MATLNKNLLKKNPKKSQIQNFYTLCFSQLISKLYSKNSLDFCFIWGFEPLYLGCQSLHYLSRSSSRGLVSGGLAHPLLQCFFFQNLSKIIKTSPLLIQRKHAFLFWFGAIGHPFNLNAQLQEILTRRARILTR